MSAANAFAEAYAEELRYRTKAKVTYYGPHQTAAEQGLPAMIPACSVRIKMNVTEFLVTFGKTDVTLSGGDTRGGFAQPGFSYDDKEMYEKLDKALADRGVVFVKSRSDWKKHKGLS